MAEQDLQKRLDKLAQRFQLWNRWVKIANRVAKTDPEKASEIFASINKYIEPKKVIRDITGFFENLSYETRQIYGSRDIQRLLMKHVPGQSPARGIGAIALIIAGIIVSVGIAWSLITYAYKVGEAEKILAREHPEYAKRPFIGIPGVGVLALILGGIFLLPKLLPKKGAA